MNKIPRVLLLFALGAGMAHAQAVGTQTVTGSVSITGPVTVTDGAGALNTIVDSGSITANAGTNLNTSALNLEATQADVRTAVQLIDNPVQVLGTDTYTEATSSGFTLGAVRRDADTTLVNTTNEFGPLQMDANGRLKVEVFSGETLPVSGTVTVTDGAGALNVICDSGCTPGGTFEDNDAFTPDTTAVGISAAEVDDTGTSPVTENSAGALRMSVRRELYNQIRDAAGNERGANVNASNALLTAQTGAIPAGTNLIGKVAADNATCGTTPVTSAFALITNSTTAPSGFTSTTCLSAIVCSNVTSSSHTLSVTDGQGSPVEILDAAVIPANSAVTFPLYGVPATTGIKWFADANSAITCAVAGWQ